MFFFEDLRLLFVQIQHGPVCCHLRTPADLHVLCIHKVKLYSCQISRKRKILKYDPTFWCRMCRVLNQKVIGESTPSSEAGRLKKKQV